MRGRDNIFLHFFDREACEYSRSYALPIARFIDVFKVVCAFSYEPMVLSGGHLFEHKAARALYRRFMGLFLTGHIRSIGVARTVEAFVSSKAAQYAHARDWPGREYSIYFDARWKQLISGPVDFMAPTADTSEQLAAALTEHIGHATEVAKRSIDVIDRRAGRAITIALFRDQHRVLASHISELSCWIRQKYQSIYRGRYAPWIFARSGLIVHAIEERLGSEYMFPVFRYIYDCIGLGRMYATPGFRVEQFRGSIEHGRLVVEMRRRFGEIDLGETWKIGVVFGRLVDRRNLGPQVRRPIEDQCRAISNSFEGLGDVGFDELYRDLSRPSPVSVSSCSAAESRESEGRSARFRSGIAAFVVVAARQEVKYVREYLSRQDLQVESNARIARRYGTVFYVKTAQGTPMRVGLLLAAAQGRAMMTEFCWRQLTRMKFRE